MTVFATLIVCPTRCITMIFTFNVLPLAVKLVGSPVTAVHGTVVPPHGPVTAFRSVAGRGKTSFVNAAILVPLALGLYDDGDHSGNDSKKKNTGYRFIYD